MSISCGFYNSVNSDRKYNASQLSQLFEGIINDGIFSSIGECFIVTANEGTKVNVGSGRAWFNSTWTDNDAILPIDCGAASSISDRIDAVVIEVNTTDAVRNNTIKVINGVISNNPVRPTLTRSNGVYQYALCYIYRAAESTQIKNSDITSVVGTETPFITGVMKTGTIDGLFEDFEDQFTEWFNGIKGTLSGDVATNLYLKIENLEEKHDAELAELDAKQEKALSDYDANRFNDVGFTLAASFLTAGTYTWAPSENQCTVMAVIVGGGQGGGAGSADSYYTGVGGGAGGAGGNAVVTPVLTLSPGVSMSIVVGKGGSGMSYTSEGTDGYSGGSSSFAGYVATGGNTGSMNSVNGENRNILNEIYCSKLPCGGAKGTYSSAGGDGGVSGVRSFVYPFTPLTAGGGGGGTRIAGGSYAPGKGGTAFLGSGGKGGTATSSINYTTDGIGGDGTYGCGGGGGSGYQGNGYGTNGGAGGDGYVLIYVLGGDVE